MKKLNNKVYFTILSILTLSLLSFIIIFNSQTYLNKQKQVENSLNVEEKFDKNSNPPDKPNDDDNNVKMLMNENNIKELVEILLDNAIKHSKENGKIKVTLTENSKIIELTVTNEGEGIPSGEEEKIFERFYRSDKSRDRSNSRFGLGLAIAKNIVTNHGGIVTAKSSEGQTTFKVLFKK